MKIITTNNQMEIKTGAATQVILGIISLTVGVALAIFIFSGAGDASSGKTVPQAWGIIGVVFAVVGILTFLTAKNRRITMIKGDQTTVFDKKLVGGKSEQQSFPTSDISAVELNTVTEMNMTTTQDNTPSSNLKSSLALVLKDNTRIMVDNAAKSANSASINGLDAGGMIQKAPLSKEANQIADFLKVPLNPDGRATSISQAVKQTADALKDKTPGIN
jgi:hypothetical protein